MKKTTINKLVLRRETIKTLLESELGRVVGGDDQTTCPESRLASGCVGVQVITPPDEPGD
jgi:hypothetical protein